MKLHGILALSLTLVTVSSVHADEVLSETRDHTAGKAAGGVTGLMIGAVGGPIGALVGAGVGMLIGGAAQDGTDSHDRAYVIRTDEGEIKTVRSPNRVFAVGEQVEYRGNRLYESNQEVAQADTAGSPKPLR